MTKDELIERLQEALADAAARDIETVPAGIPFAGTFSGGVTNRCGCCKRPSGHREFCPYYALWYEAEEVVCP